jgi:RNA-binding protein 5/10
VNPKQGTEKWPPPFDTDGAAYVFDAVSGMFYEAMADFFYDPKTKLYYGNKQKVYYTFQPGEDPPFSALAPSEGIEVTALSESNGPKPEAKKKIAISLKTTVLPGESDSTTRELTKNPKDAKKAKSAPPTNRPPKQHAVNMEKWSERGKEIREGSDAPTKDPPTTTKGQPICLLCRRKFASVEKLKQHEELSALHKENLQKEKEADAEKEQEAMASMEYRDRALERRIMHGPDTASLPALPRDLDAPAAREADVVRPEDNLGASNVGNQMLQKMGWKSGASLGRNAGSGVSSAEEGQLVKDWEKIESLAASYHHTQMKTNAREGGIGSGL